MSDTLNHMVEEYDRRFGEVQTLLNCIQHAKAEHLDVEWLDSFLQNYLENQSIYESIGHANREWDL